MRNVDFIGQLAKIMMNNNKEQMSAIKKLLLTVTLYENCINKSFF